MLTFQRIGRSFLLGLLTFVFFGMAAISAAVGSNGRAGIYLLIGAALCFVHAWVMDRWLKEEKQGR